MKLIILTQYFPPETGAPQARLSEMTERITNAGHEVTILTAMPNYPTGVIHEGYGGWHKEERLFGARVIRSYIYPTQKTDFLRRLSNYFSFVFSSAIVGTYSLKRGDYLMVQSPPLFLGLSGYWLSRVKGVRLIFNVSDLWPDSAANIGVIQRDSLFFRISKWIEAFCYRKAWLVTGQSSSIIADIESRFPGKRLQRVSNGVDTQLFHPDKYDAEARQRLQQNQGDKIMITYVGLHGLAQGLDQVINAAARLKDHDSIQFTLIGDGAEKKKLVESSKQSGYDKVHFYEPVPKLQVPAILASSDIILVPLKTSIPGSIPSKLYEAMASAKPVIIVAHGEAAEIVARCDCGLVVAPGDIDGLVNAILRLAENKELRERLGQNGRAAALAEFDRDQITHEFMTYLEVHSEEQ